MHHSWKTLLQNETEKTYFKKLMEFVKVERETMTVYPSPSDTFAAFEVPYEEVSVVILGQDPYHGAGQAHGLAFSVPPQVKPPPSLANIYKELADDVGFKHPGHGCLTAWVKQGVFLLNTTLTVREGKAGSHQGQGWEEFTDAVIRLLSSRDETVAFMLWGRHAQEKDYLIDTSKHLIMRARHPSPLSAHSGFFGSRCFSKINDGLIRKGVAPINWQIPENPYEAVARPPRHPSREPFDLDTLLMEQFPI